jgi:GntR family transcriptional repressor for pyruvate dehydrogenase complex
MPINKILKTKISDEVMEQMKENIISGEWKPGKKIPGELELVSLFGVSRISIRQAIHQFVGMGVLIIKRGDGTYVSESVPDEHFNILLPYLMIEKPGIVEVFEYRCILESKAAALAAERATEEEIDALENIHNSLKKNKDNFDKFIDYDLLFHTMIASATKNSVIAKISTILSSVIKSSMKEALEFVGVEEGLYYHTKVLEAIQAKDKPAAEDYMLRHVQSSLENVKNKIKDK